jgi:hypothetical protein
MNAAEAPRWTGNRRCSQIECGGISVDRRIRGIYTGAERSSFSVETTHESWPSPMIVQRVALAGALLLLSVTPSASQLRRPLTCTEEASTGLDRAASPEGAKAPLKARTFSLVSSGGLLTVISAGRSDYYECQPASPRLNERTPRNAVKCQNGVYFLLIDLNKLNFVEAQLNPEDRGEIRVSYGSCRGL